MKQGIEVISQAVVVLGSDVQKRQGFPQAMPNIGFGTEHRLPDRLVAQSEAIAENLDDWIVPVNQQEIPAEAGIRELQQKPLMLA